MTLDVVDHDLDLVAIGRIARLVHQTRDLENLTLKRRRADVNPALRVLTRLSAPHRHTRTQTLERLPVHHHARKRDVLVAVEVTTGGLQARLGNLQRTITAANTLAKLQLDRRIQTDLRPERHHRVRIVRRAARRQDHRRLGTSLRLQITRNNIPEATEHRVDPLDDVPLIRLSSRRRIELLNRASQRFTDRLVRRLHLANPGHQSRLATILRVSQHRLQTGSHVLVSLQRRVQREPDVPVIRHHIRLTNRHRLIRSRRSLIRHARQLILHRHLTTSQSRISQQSIAGLILNRSLRGLFHHRRQTLVLSEERLLIQIRLRSPVSLRKLRHTELTVDRVRPRQSTRLIRASSKPGTDTHTGTHAKTTQSRVQDLPTIQLVTVRQRLQHSLETLLQTFTKPVHQSRRNRPRVVAHTDRSLVQLVRAERPLRATRPVQHRIQADVRHSHRLRRRHHRRERRPGPDSNTVLHRELHARQLLHRRTSDRRRLTRESPASPHQRTSTTHLHSINTNVQTRSRRRNQRELATVIQVNLVETVSLIIPSLTASSSQLSDRTTNARTHRSLEGNQASLRPEHRDSRTQRSTRTGHSPTHVTHRLPSVRINRVIRILTIALFAPTDTLRISQTLDHIAQRIQALHRKTTMTLDSLGPAGNLILFLERDTSDRLSTRIVLLQRIPIHPTTSSASQQTSHTTSNSTNDITNAGDHRAQTRTSSRTRQSRTNHCRRVDTLLAAQAVVHLLVNLVQLRLILHLVRRGLTGLRDLLGIRLTTRLHRHTIHRLTTIHHQRTHDLIRDSLTHGVVDVLDLPTTLEHITKLDARRFIIPEGDPVLLVTEPVDRVLAFINRLVVVLDETRHELRVPPVLLALKVTTSRKLLHPLQRETGRPQRLRRSAYARRQPLRATLTQRSTLRLPKLLEPLPRKRAIVAIARHLTTFCSR